MKKLIAAIAATAVAASLAMTATFASADVYYTIPTDPASWGTWMLGSPKLDETDQLYAEETAEGYLEVSFPETGETTIPNFLLNEGGGLVQVTEGDLLHIDVTLEGEEGATDMRWLVEIAFNGAGSQRMNIAKYIGEATGNDKLVANAYGQLPSGTYNVVLDIAEVLQAYDTDNADDSSKITNNYERVFGEGGNTYLTTINFNVATNDPANNSDKDNKLIIRDFSIGTSESDFETGSTGGSTTSTDDSTTSTGGTSSTASTSSKAPTTSAGGTSSQVSTGESVLPIIGIAALAVVATSAVVVSRKRK